jgi:acyl-CoA reductase-like NAD-dependent aldehyde dehydrogenase
MSGRTSSSKATDEADAIRIATPCGLSGAVHTRDLDRGVRVARQIRTGMIHVNNATIADDSAVPFGGVEASVGQMCRLVGIWAR